MQHTDFKNNRYIYTSSQDNKYNLFYINYQSIFSILTNATALVIYFWFCVSKRCHI